MTLGEEIAMLNEKRDSRCHMDELDKNSLKIMRDTYFHFRIKRLKQKGQNPAYFAYECQECGETWKTVPFHADILADNSPFDSCLECGSQEVSRKKQAVD